MVVLETYYSRPFLKWTKEESKNNWPENKKTDEDAEGLHPKDDTDKLHVSRKEGGRRLASIQDRVDVSIQRIEDYIHKHGGKLITPIKNNTRNTIIHRIEIHNK